MSTFVNGANLAYAHETISNLGSAASLTAATYNTLSDQTRVEGGTSYSKILHPEEVLITVETAAIRWTCDGTTPTTNQTTAIGHACEAKDSIQLVGFQNIARFKAINAEAGSGAEIRVTYYR